VLLTFENEAQLTLSDFPGSGLSIVVPSVSILAESPVAVVEKNAAKHGTTVEANAYLQFLFEPQAQEIAAQHFFRPVDPKVLARHADRFPRLRLVAVTDLGGWPAIQKKHFADGAIFDQLF
jgi:sulfate/thiosulfate transport system substrate-binding protein